MYQTYLQDCQKQSVCLHNQCRKISFWRMITAAAAAIFFSFGYAKSFSFCYLLCAAAVLCFLFLVNVNNKKKDKLSYLSDFESVIHDYEARLDDSWKQFSIDGSQMHAYDMPHASDLDLLGKHSLYQHICTAGTVFGQEQLARLLTQPDLDIASILCRQQAVKELTQKTDFTLHFEASARNLKTVSYDVSKKNLDDFFHALEQENNASLLKHITINIVPLLTLIFFFCYLCGIQQDFTFSCFMICAMLQLFAAFLTNRHISRLLAPVYKMNRTLTPYRRLIDLLTQESFDSPYLQKLQQSLSQKGNAVSAFKELASIADAVVLRHNVYAYLLLNSLFCFDFHCARRYRRWQTAYRHILRIWLEAIGNVEALISLGVVARTRQTYTLPQILDSVKPVLSACELKHPLLKEQAAVGNDFNLTHQTCIITGSNMSGKTTFMRTIGVNLALAYAGGFCAASDLCVSYMKICTSMRTSDNVNEGISSFYAELLRMQNIMETSRKQQPMIAFIDEIYKGTNSKDRILAARETVKNLAKPYILTILTTHDLELCDLEYDSGIDAVNYYFTERYSQNEILFDYKIQKGRCNTTNAYYLLHMAGIL